ncbi:MAG: radical SAM family heme chaperone HemW, partial [Bdellovibrionales bacterium]|nr:radical SAM family heme chaperone HemW [Bdellovibrionales bacterium]
MRALSAKEQSSPQSPNLTNGFGLYFHIPFCVHKCSYCDFYSFTRYTASDFEGLIKRMRRELREAYEFCTRRWGALPEVTSLFIGGGTPSLLPPALLETLIRDASELFRFSLAVEVTLEANPETVDAGFSAALAQTSVNRVSLGAQSFKPRNLAVLERLGSVESIRHAVSHLRSAGFENLNLDLIASIPGQSTAAFLEDIGEALALSPTHLSFYTLSLKAEHPLASALPDTEVAADQYEAGVHYLKGRGFEQYEISNFSLPDRSCRHNLLYWTGGDFLGIGPSAASRLFREGQFYHRKQKAHFPTYLEGDFGDSPFEGSTPLQTVLEAAFLELRTNVGVHLGTFAKRYRYDLTASARYG